MKRSAFYETASRTLGRRPVLHTLFWTCLFSASVLLGSGEASLAQRALWTGGFLSVVATATYLHFYLLAKCLNRRRYFLYLAGLVFTLGGLGALYNLVTAVYFKSKGRLSSVIFSLVFFVGFTTAIRYARAGIRQRLQLQEITAKQLQTELALLKAQINPHFLFNTLNNLYAMALKEEDPATAQGIARLSHLMRYVIYESDAERVELSREVEQIRSFIDLQKLRFSEEDDIRIEFETVGDADRCSIAPMLLLPFVENAFKHGIRLSSPSYLSLRLAVIDGSICFSVENSLHGTEERTDDSDSALGLRNVRRRLELIYPDTHSLSICEGADKYRVELVLGPGSSK